MIFAIFVLPESPSFLVNKQKFDEARQSLKWIAAVNGNIIMPDFVFDTEMKQASNQIALREPEEDPLLE